MSWRGERDGWAGFALVSDRGSYLGSNLHVARREFEVPADMPLLGGRMALVDRSTPGQDASNEQT